MMARMAPRGMAATPRIGLVTTQRGRQAAEPPDWRRTIHRQG
jgi:hypothetical protein